MEQVDIIGHMIACATVNDEVGGLIGWCCGVGGQAGCNEVRHIRDESSLGHDNFVVTVRCLFM